MKRVYMVLGIAAIVAILILYFQLIVTGSYTVSFFSDMISLNTFVIYLVILSFFAGVFLTLTISSFNSSSDINDDFDL